MTGAGNAYLAGPGDAPADLALIVPVYRNAETLVALTERVSVALGPLGIDYRLVLVVDASPDESWPLVERLAAADPRIAGLQLAANVGQHAAVLAGLAAVRAGRFVVMDADLQDPPELIPDMWRLACASGRTVFGRRKGRYERWDRMATSRLFKTLFSWLTGLPTDVGTFFLVDARVAAAMLRASVRSPHVVVLARHYSAGCEFVSFTRSVRPVGRSAYSSAARWRAAAASLRCWRDCRWPASAAAGSADHRPAVAARVNL